MSSSRLWLVHSFLALVVAVVSACASESENLETSTETQESVVCGITCPYGQIPSYWTCSQSCGGICPNALVCVPAPPPSATIAASPTVVSVAPGATGTSRICWTTSYLTAPVWIRVRVDGGAGQLFTKESDNGNSCENANWIVAGHSYSFKVHTSNSDTSPSLAGVTVTGIAGAPPPPPPTCGSCSPGYDCTCGDICRRTGSICP